MACRFRYNRYRINEIRRNAIEVHVPATAGPWLMPLPVMVGPAAAYNKYLSSRRNYSYLLESGRKFQKKLKKNLKTD